MIQTALSAQMPSLLNNAYVSLNLLVKEKALLTFTKFKTKALDIDVNVYSNSDIAVCIKCYKSLVKYQKAEENVQDIKTELKSTYSAGGRRVKRLQRNEDELTPGTSPVKKHLSFVNENPTNCSSSNLTSLRLPLPRLAPSPIGKPRSCLFDSGPSHSYEALSLRLSPRLQRHGDQMSQKVKQRAK